MTRAPRDPARPDAERAAAASVETGPAPAAAFFDLDRTLMEGSSAFQFGRAAYKAGLINRRRLVADAWANLRFRVSGATDQATHELRDRISASLAGTRVRDLERLGSDVLAGVLPRIYPQVLALAHVLVLDGGIGSQFSKVSDGVYTGEPTGLFIYGQEKARAIEQLAEREGIDLSASYGYTDSASDLPMLRLVGHPVVVNPDRELLRVAREEGWEVLRIDRLSRRLKTFAAMGGAAVVGALSGAVALRARGDRRLRPWPLARG